MATFYNEDYFRSIKRDIRLAESREYSYTQSPSAYTTFDIFLSYNILDQEVVLGIYYFLFKKGFKVYLDFVVDPQLKREDCDKETAELIHNRILCSRSLIYASSFSATNSKWMPWELGVADGKKSKCFVLPVSKGYERDFNQKEYLKLYPLIKKGISNELTVINSFGNATDFRI